MTHFRSAAFIFNLVLVLSFQLTYAQETNSARRANEDNAEVREKAFKLLESLAGQLGALQSAENRARLGSNIAGSLWPHDEERARALFASVEEDIKLGLQRDVEFRVSRSDRSAEHKYQVFLKLRDDTAERMARHDPELALAFLQRTSVVNDDSLPRNYVENELSMKLRLAKRVAAKNPEVAIKLAQQSLGSKLTGGEILALLMRLSDKHRPQAQALHRDVVDKLRNADIVNNYAEWDFTANLLRYFTPPAADDSTYRELVNVVINRAFEQGCANPKAADAQFRSSYCVYVGDLLPYIEKYTPAQTSRLRHWISTEHRRGSTSLTQAWVELNELSENGTVDEILALSAKYPEIAGQIYLRAVWKADATGELERAEQIAISYNGGDAHAKAALDARVKSYHATSEEIEKELAKMRKELSGLSDRQQIPTLLGVGHFLGAQHRNYALKLLDEVDGMVNGLTPGKEQTDFQINLAMAYCFARSDRGFAIMESVLPKLNELIAAGAKLDGYETRYLRDGEWNMTGEGTVGDMLTRLARGAAYFAWRDFDRAVMLTTQFERHEIRMMAQLKLAQGILAGPRLSAMPGYSGSMY